jgi:agmatinase
MEFDPNAAASQDSGIFGLPHSEDQARLVIVPVPWDATTSYHAGAHRGPQAVLRASAQQDLFDVELKHPYQPGIHLLPEPSEILALNGKARARAERVMEMQADGNQGDELEQALKFVNDASDRVNQWVYSETRRLLQAGKIAAVLGGDHSVPFGAIRAASEKFSALSILHFDAHSDTRAAYSGFEFSHASIMHNVLTKIPSVKKLVQVGIRDYCEDEVRFVREQELRVKVFFDADLQRKKFDGQSWSSIVKEIVSSLSNEVWISFDIDGLDPKLCPGTGTPVPGGLEFQEAVYLISQVARSGRKIVGFDLNEVAPPPEFPDTDDEWDANVGMRLLYKLCGWTFESQGLLTR